MKSSNKVYLGLPAYNNRELIMSEHFFLPAACFASFLASPFYLWRKLNVLILSCYLYHHHCCCHQYMSCKKEKCKQQFFYLSKIWISMILTLENVVWRVQYEGRKDCWLLMEAFASNTEPGTSQYINLVRCWTSGCSA